MTYAQTAEEPRLPAPHGPLSMAASAIQRLTGRAEASFVAVEFDECCAGRCTRRRKPVGFDDCPVGHFDAHRAGNQHWAERNPLRGNDLRVHLG